MTGINPCPGRPGDCLGACLSHRRWHLVGEGRAAPAAPTARTATPEGPPFPFNDRAFQPPTTWCAAGFPRGMLAAGAHLTFRLERRRCRHENPVDSRLRLHSPHAKAESTSTCKVRAQAKYSTRGARGAPQPLRSHTAGFFRSVISRISSRSTSPSAPACAHPKTSRPSSASWVRTRRPRTSATSRSISTRRQMSANVVWTSIRCWPG